MAQGVPRSTSFAFDVAVRAVDEQLARIDSLDSKAGILLAADGVSAGLIFVRGGVIARAPIGLALVVSVTILLSLVCTLVSFADTCCDQWRRTGLACEAKPDGSRSAKRLCL